MYACTVGYTENQSTYFLWLCRQVMDKASCSMRSEIYMCTCTRNAHTMSILLTRCGCPGSHGQGVWEIVKRENNINGRNIFIHYLKLCRYMYM